jgi:hypothetical protein
VRAGCSRFALAGLLLCLTGCGTIAYRTGEPLAALPWPITRQDGGSLTVSIAGGAIGDWSAASVKEWRNRVFIVYRKSGLFKEVREGFVDADRRVEFKAGYEVKDKWGYSTFTLITLGLIPSSSINRLTLVTTIRDREGNPLGTITKTAEYVTVIQTLLMFAFWVPSDGPMYVRTIDDLCRASIIEAHEKGFL